jgi:purine nucleosidase
MDFNVQADTSAAWHVLRSVDPERTTLVPIEVTSQTALRRSHLAALDQAGRLCRLIARQAREFERDEHNAERHGQACPGLPDDIINFQHDPLACAVALGWDGVTVETLPLALALEDGRLRIRVGRSRRGMQVVTEVDRARFDDFWLETVTRRRADSPHL